MTKPTDTEAIYVADDGSYYAESEVRSWTPGDDGPLPEAISVPVMRSTDLVWGADGLPHIDVVEKIYRKAATPRPVDPEA